MNYHVPNLTLDTALKLEESLNHIIPEEEFLFDFSRMSNFDPLPMLMAGAIIKRYRGLYPEVRFSVAGIDTKGKGYAGTMGFFKYISPTLDIGKAPGEAMGSSNYIPITLIRRCRSDCRRRSCRCCRNPASLWGGSRRTASPRAFSGCRSWPARSSRPC